MKKFLLPAISLCATLLTAQAQYFTNGNLAVMRISGQAANGSGSSVTGAAMIIDQYTTSGTLVSSFHVPTTGANALLNVGLSYSGLMTLAADGSKLVFAGYNTALPYSPGGMNFATAALVPRGLGTMDAYGVFSLPFTSYTNFSGFTAIGGASDGTNYWMTGNGPTGEFQSGLYPQVVYLGTPSASADSQVCSNVFSSGIRAVNVYNTGGTYGLYASGYASNTAFSTTKFGAGTFLLSNLSGALPTTFTGSTNIFPLGTASAGGGGDCTISPDGTMAYVSDLDLGIAKYTFSGGVWTSNYSFVITSPGYVGSGSKEPISVTADWSQTPPVVYATTAETFTNRLISFQDTGSTPTINVLAIGTVVTGSGGATNTFRGVRFVPTVQYGYVSVPPVPFIGNPGLTATFTAGVLGSPAPTVQWYSNSVANPTYVAIPGATSSNYSLANINTSESGSRFYIVVSNVYGASTSAPVSLTVRDPAITSQPVGATNFPGGAAVTLCVGAAGSGTLTYQWLSNGVSLGAAAQMACYTVPSSAVSNTALYSVIVSNSFNETITSTPTAVSFSPYLVFDTMAYANGNLFTAPGTQWMEESGTTPIIATNDTVEISQVLGSNGTAFGQDLFSQPQPYGGTVLWASFILNLKTLPSSASGSYIAYFQDTNFDFYGRIVAVTSNNPAYTPDIPANAYPGTYRIGIANFKTTIPSAVVELDMAPGIDYQVVEYFDEANMICQVAVNPNQTNYTQVYSEAADTASALVSKDTSDSFTPTNYPIAAYGLREATGEGVLDFHDLEVSYDWSTNGSGYAAVTANANPATPVIGLITPGITNYAGNSNVLEVAASGIDLTYQWYQGTVALSDGNSISGSSTCVLTISPEVGTNSGNYTVVISNEANVVTSSVVPVFINTTPTAPIFTLQPVSVTNSLGASVTFTATAVGTGPITYTWNTDGSPNGATGTSFTLPRITTNLSGNYYSVTADNGVAPDATSSNAYLTVLGPVVTNIAFLRSLQVTNAAPTITVPSSNSTQVYQVTGVVFIATNIESSTYAEYYIQDSTAGIEFFVTDPTFRPNKGDVITVSGVVDTFDDALELDGSPNNPQEPYSITSTNREGLPLPFPPELIPFGFGTANPGLSSLVYQGSLAVITNVYFATPGAAFAGNGTVVVSNLAGQTYSLYISQSAGPDLAGQPVPAFAYSVSGAYDQFDSTYELNLSAGTDIVTAPPPAVTNLASSFAGGNVTLNWTAVPGSYTYSVWATTNLTVPFAPLAPGLWFNSTNGTYSAPVPPGTPAMFYEIVSP